MNIPYGKVTIYVLTFLGYIYSGYGSGLLGNLREAILAAESVFGSFLGNAVKVAKNLKFYNDIFDAAVEEDCIFKCPNGAPPKPNRKHVPAANGCGALGLNIKTEYLPVAAMKKCCDAHDICYDTCNRDKEVCDMEFKRCLYQHCESYSNSIGGQAIIKACKGGAKMLFTGTLALGCRAYLDAQKNACYCTPVSWKEQKKKSKYTSGGDQEL